QGPQAKPHNLSINIEHRWACETEAAGAMIRMPGRRKKTSESFDNPDAIPTQHGSTSDIVHDVVSQAAREHSSIERKRAAVRKRKSSVASKTPPATSDKMNASAPEICDLVLPEVHTRERVAETPTIRYVNGTPQEFSRELETFLSPDVEPRLRLLT